MLMHRGNQQIELAQYICTDPTGVEQGFLQCLRARQLGVKFRRQDPIWTIHDCRRVGRAATYRRH